MLVIVGVGSGNTHRCAQGVRTKSNKLPNKLPEYCEQGCEQRFRCNHDCNLRKLDIQPQKTTDTT